MGMTPQRLKEIAPHASPDCIMLNCSASGADVKPSVRNGALAKKKREVSHPRKRHVSITSYRVRRADAEGLCPKYFVDALRYAGIIHDDTEDDITFQIQQKKVSEKKEEKTLIEVTL